jgi:hypothetical protein
MQSAATGQTEIPDLVRHLVPIRNFAIGAGKSESTAATKTNIGSSALGTM